ncbi:hypothetical protein VNO78_15073 [Psophocarpus tetragonolobus]|uniref:Uncharacterized protein n=1 Tax=Psophocarpus tetragonolobus TaxID=3891 RepID=A0AAN9XIV5_PSOTE
MGMQRRRSCKLWVWVAGTRAYKWLPDGCLVSTLKFLHHYYAWPRSRDKDKWVLLVRQSNITLLTPYISYFKGLSGISSNLIDPLKNNTII